MVSFRRIDQLFQIVDIYRGIPHAAYDTQILLKDLKWQKRLIQGPQVKIQANPSPIATKFMSTLMT